MPRSVPEDKAYYEQLQRALNEVDQRRNVTVAVDLEGSAEAITYVLRGMALSAPPVSDYRLHIAAHVAGAGSRAAILEALGSSSATVREAGARASGLLKAQSTIPVLGLLLTDPAGAVRRAATEALGRIGGPRAADQLLHALSKRPPHAPWLLLALVRAASDQYIDNGLTGSAAAVDLGSLALVAGMRRRSAARPRLFALLTADDPMVRASACRAVGWFGLSTDVPTLRAVLASDPDPRVRESASRAVRWFRASDESARPASHPASQEPARPAINASQPAAMTAVFREALAQRPVGPDDTVRVAGHERNPISPLLASLWTRFRGRSRQRSANSRLPLSRQEFARTPYRYKPDPALVEPADGSSDPH